jgi:hypothetical protein
MRTTALAAAAVLVTTAFAARASAQGEPAWRAAAKSDWIQLFNGRDLAGFVPKIRGYAAGDNFGRTFRVENGAITVSYEAYDKFSDRFGHLFYEKPFSHYVLVVEYRFVGEQATAGPDWAFRNSGVMIHGQPLSTMGKDQDFPISIEVQMLGGRETGERTTANLCTPGTHVVMKEKLVTDHCVNSTSKTFRGDQWVRLEIEAHGNGQIVHRVNGEAVLTYEKAQVGGGAVSGFDPAAKVDGTMLEEGTISLQSESHPVEFRKVELLNLVGCMDKKSKKYRPWFEKSDPAACR